MFGRVYNAASTALCAKASGEVSGGAATSASASPASASRRSAICSGLAYGAACRMVCRSGASETEIDLASGKSVAACILKTFDKVADPVHLEFSGMVVSNLSSMQGSKDLAKRFGSLLVVRHG